MNNFKFQSVNKIIEESIKKNWDLPALSNYKGVTLFYRDLAQKIAKLHIAFEQCGLNKGDTVAICSRNQANWGVAFLGAITYGAVPVPLLHEFKAGNIHYLVNHCEAKVLFVDEVTWEGLSAEEMPCLQVVAELSTFRFLFAKTEELAQIREHLNENFGKKYPSSFEKTDVVYYEDKADELALINYTSGTSGISKGVMIPYRAIYSNIDFAKNYAAAQMKSGDNVVAMLPSAHMYGLMFEFLFEMTIGAHVHFLTRIPSPKIILQAFKEIKPAIIIAVPLIIEKIYKSKLKPILDKNKIFFQIPILDKVLEKKVKDELVEAFGGNFEEIILGGAAFNPEVEDFFNKINFPYTVGYGMTECAPIMAYAHWDKTKKHSCGQKVVNIELRIDSPNPEEIAGEVQVKGANVFLGYYKNKEETKKVFTKDGWFKTGDMGIIDKDGFLFLKGRSKCMILGPSGQNIYPEELEALINNLTYVVDSLVIDEEKGLKALIYLDYNQAELDGFSKSKLEERIANGMKEVNKEIPNYANISKLEFMSEDFERTPKRSIKRYLYQRK